MNPFVPHFVLQRLAEGQTEGSFDGAVLFADLSGVTELSEAFLAQGTPGAEALDRTLRFYFDPLVAAVHGGGGFVAHFAGAAFTAVFPGSDQHNAAWFAAQAAARMQRFLREHATHETAAGSFSFGLRLGMAWGTVHWGIVQPAGGRALYFFHGPALEAGAAARDDAPEGEALLDAALYRRIRGGDARAAGEDRYRLGQLAVQPPVPLQPAEDPADPAPFQPAGLETLPPEGEPRDVATLVAVLDAVTDLPELMLQLGELAEALDGMLAGPTIGRTGPEVRVHFGALRPLADAPGRAVDLALRLRSLCKGGLSVRAGIAYGRDYAGFSGGAGRLEPACLGRPAAVAAELARLAPPGEIWCAPELVELVSAPGEWQAQGSHALGGLEGPTPVHALAHSLEPVREPAGSEDAPAP
jgi:class 3 adenylate cyclase